MSTKSDSASKKTGISSIQSLNTLLSSMSTFTNIEVQSNNDVVTTAQDFYNRLDLLQDIAIPEENDSSLSSQLVGESLDLVYDNTEMKLVSNDKTSQLSKEVALQAAYSVIHNVPVSSTDADMNGNIVFPSLCATTEYTSSSQSPNPFSNVPSNVYNYLCNITGVSSSSLLSKRVVITSNQHLWCLIPGEDAPSMLALIDLKDMTYNTKHHSITDEIIPKTCWFQVHVDGRPLNETYTNLELNSTSTYAILSNTCTSQQLSQINDSDNCVVVRLPDPMIDLPLVMHTQQQSFINQSTQHIEEPKTKFHTICPGVYIQVPNNLNTNNNSLTQVSFHPLSSIHLCILTSSSIFYIYAFTTSWSKYEQCFNLNTMSLYTDKQRYLHSYSQYNINNNNSNSELHSLPLLSSPSLTTPSMSVFNLASTACLNTPNSNSNSNTASVVEEVLARSTPIPLNETRLSSTAYVGFSFGSPSLPYSTSVFSVYFLTQHGHMAVLAPVIPHGTVLPAEPLLEFRTRLCCDLFEEREVVLTHDKKHSLSLLAWIDITFDLVSTQDIDDDSVVDEEDDSRYEVIVNPDSEFTLDGFVRSCGYLTNGIVNNCDQEKRALLCSLNNSIGLQLLSLPKVSITEKTGTTDKSSTNKATSATFLSLSVLETGVPTTVTRTSIVKLNGTQSDSTKQCLYSVCVDTHILVTPLYPVFINSHTLPSMLFSSDVCDLNANSEVDLVGPLKSLVLSTTKVHSANNTFNNDSDNQAGVLLPIPHTMSLVCIEKQTYPISIPKSMTSQKLWNELYIQSLNSTFEYYDLISKDDTKNDDSKFSTNTVANPLKPSFSLIKKNKNIVPAATVTKTSGISETVLDSKMIQTKYANKSQIVLLFTLVQAYILLLRQLQLRSINIQASTVTENVNSHHLNIITSQFVLWSLSSYNTHSLMSTFIQKHQSLTESYDKNTTFYKLFITAVSFVLSYNMSGRCEAYLQYGSHSSVLDGITNTYIQASGLSTTPTLIDIQDIDIPALVTSIESLIKKNVCTSTVLSSSCLRQHPSLGLLAHAYQQDNQSVIKHMMTQLSQLNQAAMNAVTLMNNPSLPLGLLTLNSALQPSLVSLPNELSSIFINNINNIKYNNNESQSNVVHDNAIIQKLNTIITSQQEHKHSELIKNYDVSKSKSKSKTDDDESMNLVRFLELYTSGSSHLTPVQALASRIKDISTLSNSSLSSLDDLVDLTEIRKRLHTIILHCHSVNIDITCRAEALKLAMVEQATHLVDLRSTVSELTVIDQYQSKQIEILEQLQSALIAKSTFLKQHISSKMNGLSISEKEYQIVLLQIQDNTQQMQLKIDQIREFCDIIRESKIELSYILSKQLQDFAAAHNIQLSALDINKETIFDVDTDTMDMVNNDLSVYKRDIDSNTESLLELNTRLATVKEQLKFRAMIQ